MLCVRVNLVAVYKSAKVILELVTVVMSHFTSFSCSAVVMVAHPLNCKGATAQCIQPAYSRTGGLTRPVISEHSGLVTCHLSALCPVRVTSSVYTDC